jgi:hypothetical protein
MDTHKDGGQDGSDNNGYDCLPPSQAKCDERAANHVRRDVRIREHPLVSSADLAFPWHGIRGALTKVVESPERPCSPTFLNRLDVIVDPSIRHSTSLVRHLQLSEQVLEARHDCSGNIRVPRSNAREKSSAEGGGDGLKKVDAGSPWKKHVLQVSGD